jgi:hypothetical protein
MKSMGTRKTRKILRVQKNQLILAHHKKDAALNRIILNKYKNGQRF